MAVYGGRRTEALTQIRAATKVLVAQRQDVEVIWGEGGFFLGGGLL